MKNNNGNGKRTVISLLPVAGTVTTTKQQQQEPTPTEQDLKGRTIELWDEPSWPQCELCSKFYKPTAIDFHKKICSYNGNPTKPEEPEEPVPPEIQDREPEEPEPEQQRGVKCAKCDKDYPSTAMFLAHTQACPGQPEPETDLGPEPDTLSTDNEGIRCNNCHRVFLNSIRYRNHKCADWVK